MNKAVGAVVAEPALDELWGEDRVFPRPIVVIVGVDIQRRVYQIFGNLSILKA
jgi:hypothetical protein